MKHKKETKKMKREERDNKDCSFFGRCHSDGFALSYKVWSLCVPQKHKSYKVSK